MSTPAVFRSSQTVAGSAQKKRKASIGDIPLDAIPIVEENLASILQRVELFASSDDGKFSDLEDIAVIKNTLTQALDIMKNVKELSEEKNNKGLDVKAIPFSKFSHTLLSTRLGVKLIDIKSFANVQDFQAHLFGALQKHEGSNTLLNTQAIVDAMDIHDLGPLTRMLGRINFSVNSQSEARGRMLIDQWLLELIDISSTLSKSSRNILIPEFSISQLKKRPAKIVYSNQVTYLTGSTDYALWSVTKNSQQVHKLAVTQTNIAGYVFAWAFTNEEHLTFYEAKRAGESLSGHVPQVVAQCLALCSKKDDMNLKAIAFCLTTGDDWIFGLVDGSEIQDSASPNICWISGLYHIESGSSLKLPNIRTFMKLILLWTLQRPDVLRDAIKELL